MGDMQVEWVTFLARVYYLSITGATTSMGKNRTMSIFGAPNYKLCAFLDANKVILRNHTPFLYS